MSPVSRDPSTRNKGPQPLTDRTRHRASAIFLTAIVLVTTLSTPAGADTDLDAVTVYNSWEEEDGTANSSGSQYLDFRTGGSLFGMDLDLEGSGRVTYIEDEIEPGDDDLNRLYTLAVTLSHPEQMGWLTLGRQPVQAITASDIIDGLSLSVGRGPLSINGRVGQIADVAGFDPDDESTWGLGADYRIIPGMYLGLDYAQRLQDGSKIQEFIALDYYYSWFRFTKAYLTMNYDLMSETFHEFDLGTDVFMSDSFTFTLEYSQDIASFEADSIYSVFSVDAAQVISFALLFTPNPSTRYAWEYAYESYEDSGSGRWYALNGTWTPGRSRIYAQLLQHTGTGGELVELSLDASTPVLPSLRLGLGGDVSRTEYETDDEDILSYAVYVGGEWTMSRYAQLTFRMEQTSDDILEDPTMAARAALVLEF